MKKKMTFYTKISVSYILPFHSVNRDLLVLLDPRVLVVVLDLL